MWSESLKLSENRVNRRRRKMSGRVVVIKNKKVG